MSEVAALVARLRAALDVDAGASALQPLYETWVARDAWRRSVEAVPLLLGVDPAGWAACRQGEVAAWAAALDARLGADLGVASDGDVTPAQLRRWARDHAVALPACAEQLLDFIASVVLGVEAEAAAPAAAARAAEREMLLGAALALVTRFPQQCRDEHGFFDGARIADQILAKAVLWFPLQPPQASREEIAALIESYLT
ncbi:MAG: hypothetical protein H6977_14900 [Gammaproteobacteria bacterium]|nr:hypothetical protein [Gammaproteobacteria bacterium]MCP5201298.1 hypothetical protein [Gammaproteobacteria bacterium]